ncbi:MAG: DUF4388 domain-containing protein [Planctomycetota bacterium]|nr:DUF4388 domain-containing protein [Planctomycetota bacterium]
MVLRGELRDVGLAEVFQMLVAAGKEGTLSIKSGKRKMHIYFGKGPMGKVRLLREGGVSHTALGKLLLRAGRISQSQLGVALEKQKQTRGLLGQILVEMNAISEQDIENCVKTQLEEEICNVFLWENAEFEFVPGEPLAPFVDMSLLGKEIKFEVCEILLEAARRVDEWRKVLEEIEKTKTEFEVARKDSLPPDPSLFGFSYEDVQQVVELINQVRRVDEVVGRAPLSKLEVARLLAFLLRSGYIRKVEKKEEVTIKPAPVTTPSDWRIGLSFEFQDAKLKNQVETICWTEKTKEAAVVRIVELADSMVKEGRLDEVVPVYQFALDLQPDNAVVRTKLVHLYVLQWRFADAAKVLVEGYKRQITPPS